MASHLQNFLIVSVIHCHKRGETSSATSSPPHSSERLLVISGEFLKPLVASVKVIQAVLRLGVNTESLRI